MLCVVCGVSVYEPKIIREYFRLLFDRQCFLFLSYSTYFVIHNFYCVFCLCRWEFSRQQNKKFRANSRRRFRFVSRCLAVHRKELCNNFCFVCLCVFCKQKSSRSSLRLAHTTIRTNDIIIIHTLWLSLIWLSRNQQCAVAIGGWKRWTCMCLCNLLYIELLDFSCRPHERRQCYEHHIKSFGANKENKIRQPFKPIITRTVRCLSCHSHISTDIKPAAVHHDHDDRWNVAISPVCVCVYFFHIRESEIRGTNETKSVPSNTTKGAAYTKSTVQVQAEKKTLSRSARTKRQNHITYCSEQERGVCVCVVLCSFADITAPHSTNTIHKVEKLGV